MVNLYCRQKKSEVRRFENWLGLIIFFSLNNKESKIEGLIFSAQEQTLKTVQEKTLMTKRYYKNVECAEKEMT